MWRSEREVEGDAQGLEVVAPRAAALHVELDVALLDLRVVAERDLAPAAAAAGQQAERMRWVHRQGKIHKVDPKFAS